MKKTITTFASLFVILSAFAQPVLNYSATHSIGINSTWYYIGGSTSGLSLTGANVTWDLSANGCTSLGTFNSVDATTTPSASTYPASNLAFEMNQTGGSLSYVYLIDSTTGLRKMADGIGSATPNVLVDYEEVVQYPYHYLDVFNGTSQTSTGSPVNYTSTYDGYGTLIINSHTYNNVIRVSQTTGDVTLYATAPVMFPLIWTTGGYYFLNESATFMGVDDLMSKIQVAVYPNPASTMVTVNIDRNFEEPVTLNIYNVMGKLVHTEILDKKQQTDVRNLSNGIYMLEIKAKTWTENQKLIIQR